MHARDGNFICFRVYRLDQIFKCLKLINKPHGLNKINKQNLLKVAIYEMQLVNVLNFRGGKLASWCSGHSILNKLRKTVAMLCLTPLLLQINIQRTEIFK